MSVCFSVRGLTLTSNPTGLKFGTQVLEGTSYMSIDFGPNDEACDVMRNLNAHITL